MNRADINAALRSNQVQMILSVRRHEAAKQLFDAACFAGEGVEAQKQREAVHATMDELLDLSATAMTLTRQLMELPG
jgi:hypothetical protein